MILFLLFAAKALVENKCKILQLAVKILNDLHQLKTKTVKGPDSESLRDRRERTKAVGCRRRCLQRI